jgi:hypothetical protein
MKMSGIARLVFPCLLGVLAQQAPAAEVYRWVDAAGEVHYSATPPPGGQQAEQMNVRVGKGSAPAPAAAPGQPEAESAQPPQKPAEQKAREDQEYEAERQAQCANARSIVERLETRPASRYKREDGSYQRYPDGEREKMIGDARAFQAEHCN